MAKRQQGQRAYRSRARRAAAIRSQAGESGLSSAEGPRRFRRAAVPSWPWRVSRRAHSEGFCPESQLERHRRPKAWRGRWFAARSRTLPGASAHFRLLVRGTQTTVASRLRLSASPWTTTTGLRKPGPDTVGGGRSAHQTSPWKITLGVFQASSGAWRATYSLSAVLKIALRDRRARRASRSAFAKTSSGIETAIFIPRV